MVSVRMMRKRLWIVFLIFTITVPIMYIAFIRNMNSVKAITEKSEVKDEEQVLDHALKVVHLDLKGAPPRMEYLTRFLTLVVQQGCNALLIEYEDMFPYSGRLVNSSATNAYTQQQVRKFLSLARDHDIEIIPLVQTFGHLEFVLKLQEFRSLRELDPFPQEICPSNSNSIKLIEEMIEQVMQIHPFIKYLHIGCDEVYHLAACVKCNDRQLSANDIFGEHVLAVAQLIKNKYPTVTPIIWDDMIRQWPLEMLRDSQLTQIVEPMVWAYTTDVPNLIRHYTWHKYTKIFKRIWVAGAFKGATTATSILPNLIEHYENQKSWINYIKNTKVPIAGIVLTGWSRYDHFSVLCELLPPSIPSLMLSLQAIKYYKLNDVIIFDKWSSSIKCPWQITPQNVTKDTKLLTYCRFEGSDLYTSILHYNYLKMNINIFIKTFTETKGWLTGYNIKHNFTSPFRLIEEHSLYTIHQLIERLQHFKNDTREIMNQYFDKYTIEEWLELKVNPLENKLTELINLIDNMMKRFIWPRRPIS